MFLDDVTLPAECVADCSHSGQCDKDVEFWHDKLEFHVPRLESIEFLIGLGAWPLHSDKYDVGLNDMSDDALAQKVLWVMACDKDEENHTNPTPSE